MSDEEKGLFSDDPEMAAMANVFSALRPLEPDAQQRVLDYVEKRLGLVREVADKSRAARVQPDVRREDPDPDAILESQNDREQENNQAPEERGGDDSDLEGISPIARKWMLRNDLSASTLSAYYSLGVDEIDLVAKKVPGTSARERLRNVLLLQGVASYLSGGAARIDKVKLKDSIAHYDADVGGNFTSYLKGWASEISGSRSGGDLGLTTRGLVAARDLITEMSAANNTKAGKS